MKTIELCSSCAEALNKRFNKSKLKKAIGNYSIGVCENCNKTRYVCAYEKPKMKETPKNENPLD